MLQQHLPFLLLIVPAIHSLSLSSIIRLNDISSICNQDFYDFILYFDKNYTGVCYLRVIL